MAVRTPPAAIPLTPVQAEHRARFLSKIESGKYCLEDVPRCRCGSSEGTELASQDRYGIPVGVILCSCGLARTSPRLAAECLPAFYEHDYHGLHFGVSEPTAEIALFRKGQGAAIARFVGDLLPAGPLRVADVGAGTGQVLRQFMAVIDLAEGVGCEYSRAFVEAGRKAGSDLRHGGPETLDGTFDLVILSHVVEHFPDPVTDLAVIRGLGNSDTLYYVEVPGLLSVDHMPEYAYRLSEYLTLAHTFHFTLDSLVATMVRAGFRLVKGDETVRSIFLHGPYAEPKPDPSLAPRIRSSLRRLDSPRMRVKRLKPYLRRMAGRVAKALLSSRMVQAIRARRA